MEEYHGGNMRNGKNDPRPETGST